MIGGQIIEHTAWETPDLFLVTSVVCMPLSVVLAIVYHVAIKNHSEKRVVEKKAALLEQMKKNREDKSESKAPSGTEVKHTLVGSMRANDSFLAPIEMSQMTISQDIYTVNT